jgi:hypothetical protein
VAIADEELTKQQIINRSAPICRDLLDATAPHREKADDARAKEQWERFIHQARLAISTARPYGRELRRLRPDTGARKYGRFLNHGRAALTWLDGALDALEDERTELALHRQAIAQEHFKRAKRNAKRYGLRRPCIKVVS